MHDFALYRNTPFLFFRPKSSVPRWPTTNQWIWRNFYGDSTPLCCRNIVCHRRPLPCLCRLPLRMHSHSHIRLSNLFPFRHLADSVLMLDFADALLYLALPMLSIALPCLCYPTHCSASAMICVALPLRCFAVPMRCLTAPCLAFARLYRVRHHLAFALLHTTPLCLCDSVHCLCDSPRRNTLPLLCPGPQCQRFTAHGCALPLLIPLIRGIFQNPNLFAPLNEWNNSNFQCCMARTLHMLCRCNVLPGI